MRRDTHADTRRRVAREAIALGVTAHAGVQRSLSLSAVQGRAAKPHFGRRMKASRGAHVGRGSQRNPEARVAFGTKRLWRVTAAAARLVALRLLGMDRQIIVGMNAGGTHPAIVAIHAFLLAMASRAGIAAIGCHPAMPYDPVGIVTHPEEPLRRVQPALGKTGDQPPVRLRKMASPTFRARVGSTAVTPQTLLHARQMRARRRRAQPLVALLASHVGSGVPRVREMHARGDRLGSRHHSASTRPVARMAGTAGGGGRAALDLLLVTRQAGPLRRHQAVGGPTAGFGADVAARARKARMRGLGVVDA